MQGQVQEAFKFRDFASLRLDGFHNALNTNYERLMEHTQSITYIEEIAKMT